MNGGDLPPTLLAIDDYADFYALWKPAEKADPSGLVNEDGAHGGVQGEARPRRPEASGQMHPLQILGVLLREGRCANIHVALRSTSCRRRETMLAGYQRLWVGAANFQESYVMWDSIIASEISSHVRGRGICSDIHGQPAKAQVVWTPDPGDPNLTSEDRLQLQALRSPLPSSAPSTLQLALVD
ncbi:hypothetical protein CLV37_1375 [Kineococcus rhizosphaerae]|uniref:Uncharacterized protein n=1 Tax=Kineococcus rhizosphaerae TaxID=559628 RepID=A0A2T0QMG9_9ACTN|nr:hypothetical protein CLV37_1375 [Kineococcus rhizosphaerae]